MSTAQYGKMKIFDVVDDLIKTTPNVKFLCLNERQLDGEIPLNICRLQHLQVIDLSGNYLTGNIPRAFGNLNLKMLNLSGNDFSLGTMSSFTLPKTLEVLNLSSCRLTGVIPVELGELYRSLRVLNLSNNFLTGEIPYLGEDSEYEGEFYTPPLRVLNLSGNRLTGTIPFQLTFLRNIERLYLGYNKLTGSIDEEFGHMPKLIKLSLRSNDLSGEIPRTLLKGIKYVDWEGNPKLTAAT